MEYYHIAFDTPSQERRYSYWRGGGGITIHQPKWDLSLAANSPVKQWEGDLTTKGSAQYAATFMYKIKNWSLGIDYHYSGHNNYTRGNCDGFRYKVNEDWKRLHTSLMFTASWSFSKGKARRHASKTLSNGNYDYGLTKDTKPQMAQ